MHFLDFPEEVIEGCVLKYLHWNDLLRFRRVCKWTKDITDGYLRLNPELAPELEIDEGSEKTFAAFTALNITTNKLFINNPSGHLIYEKADNQQSIPRFLQRKGRQIHHLRVTQVSLYPCENEWTFFEGLKNLKSFEASYFGFGPKLDCPQISMEVAQQKLFQAQQDPRFVEHSMPTILKTLASIKIGQDPEIVIGNITNRSGGILEYCPKLQYACLPFNTQMASSSTFTLPPNHGPDQTLARAFIFLENHIDMLTASSTKTNPAKFQYDFENYHDETPSDLNLNAIRMNWYASSVFLDICQKANELGEGIRFSNVSPVWFCQWNVRNEDANFIGLPILSLVDLHPCIIPVNLPNLEEIEIRATSRSVVSEQGDDVQERPEWPALKRLRITVNGKHGETWNFNRQTRRVEDVNKFVIQKTSHLFKFLFGGGIRREGLRELVLIFEQSREIGREAGFAVPKTEEIVESCGNLRKLRIKNWQGTNKQLSRLWSGLPGLEEVELENCEELGNVAFVGENVEDPVFLRLKNLKKLSLKGLHNMPKVTDTLFKMVLKRMKLTHLILTSDRPLYKITLTGISALLEGEFAESIEKFPFSGWSLARAGEREFRKLEMKFRAYYMV